MPVIRKLHPCVSGADEHHSAKMHNFSSDQPGVTSCGLRTTDEDEGDRGDRGHGYTSLCPVCWPRDPWTDEAPPPREEPWTDTGGGPGDLIAGREDW